MKVRVVHKDKNRPGFPVDDVYWPDAGIPAVGDGVVVELPDGTTTDGYRVIHRAWGITRPPSDGFPDVRSVVGVAIVVDDIAPGTQPR